MRCFEVATSYVVLPTYNEGDNLRQLSEVLLSLDVPDLRVLVIDDASPDGTGDLADALASEHPGRVEVIHRAGKQGLGSAYRLGFATALERGADFIIQMDADLSHPPSLIPQMLDALKQCDVVVGSRYTKGGGLDPKWPLRRKLLSWAANSYIRLVLGLPVSDVTTGFCGYTRKSLQEVDLQSIRCTGFVFLAELKYACHRLDLQMEELPFVFNNRLLGESKMSLAIVIEALWKVWMLRLTPRRARLASNSPGF